ncbi:Crp/Fnr family transcriptional regulator [Salinibacter altiplanensis]|uniref:Crp/Fnr family transcriptional regulator n=1 Tax=Salinibacter altiplanensis TaxID=1803181 RepID=UPI000C9FC59C|nr:cyclic nucleotide-binding domain-containing protein [Salinibacter altiplanensis]
MSFFRPLLRAGARLYRWLFRRRLDSRTREIAERLRNVPAFNHLSSSALYAMADVTHRRTYRRGEPLYYEGDPGLGLYVVEAGRVQLVTDRAPESARELRVVETGEMIGGLSLLGDFRRLETAETTAETQVLGFFRPDLKNVMRRTPKAGMEITMALARHLAAQHVGLIRRYEEQADARTALRAYAEAAAAVEEEGPAEV